MDHSEGTDPYIDPITGVLINLRGITDEGTLREAEAALSAARLFQMIAQPVTGAFDLAHLQRIHRQIFGDLYPWAGELRTVAIAKGNSLFALPAFIETYGSQLLAEIAIENMLRGLDKDRFVTRIAYYFGELNTLHPFREGNGRAQREFLRQLGVYAGWEIAWEEVDAEEMIAASIHAMHHDDSHIAAILRRITRPLAP